MLTPDILLNADLFAQHQFAFAQQKKLIQETVSEVLHAPPPDYDESELEFLFKQARSAQKSSSPPKTEDSFPSPRVRNYV